MPQSAKQRKISSRENLTNEQREKIRIANSKARRESRKKIDPQQQEMIKIIETRSRRASRQRLSPQARREVQTAETRSRRASRQCLSPQARTEVQTVDTQSRRASRQRLSPQERREVQTAETRSRRASRQCLSPQARTEVQTVDTRSRRILRAQNSSVETRDAATKSSEIFSGSQKVISLDGTRDAIGTLKISCKFCNALKFKGETNSVCCLGGKISLDLFPKPFSFIQNLLEKSDQETKLIRKYLRAINNAVCLSSLRVNERRTRGFNPSVIFEGKVHHLIGPIEGADAGSESFAQIYVRDASLLHTSRHQNLFLPESLSLSQKNTISDAVSTIQRSLIEVNPYIQDFRQICEMSDEHLSAGNIIISSKERPSGQHARRYNDQICLNEIAILKDTFSHDIVLNKREGGIKIISNLNPSGMPLHFTLLFPYGTKGWDPSINHKSSSKRVTARQFFAYHLNIRENSSDFLFRAERLFQEWVCMAWAIVEDEKLNYLKLNQKSLRVSSYNSLNSALDQAAAGPSSDQLYADDAHSPRIGRVILPSTFFRGPRYYNKQFQNGMAVCRKFHKPDLFITITCNPNWVEIQENLLSGQSAYDRPDITARVFKQKLDQFIKDIDNGIFGKHVARLSCVEFQKRGLPHCHILIILNKQSREKLHKNIDEFVSAELPPDPLTFENNETREQAQRLEEIVLSNMIHGPCCNENPNSPCMINDKCSKGFPKPYQANSFIDPNGTNAILRRRSPLEGGREISNSNGRKINNQNVVPYSPFLLLRYNCHINVEICASALATKYLYKYITKGCDRAMVNTQVDAPGLRNEIDEYTDLRSFGSTEAAYLLFSFPIVQCIPSVIALRVHLKDMQHVTFSEDNAGQALESQRKTELTEFFAFNTEQLASGISKMSLPKYVDMLDDHTYNLKSKKWCKRKQKQSYPTVGRVNSIHPLAGDVFYLRMLLHSDFCKGATSFENLLVDTTGMLCETYKQVCLNIGLLSDDAEWENVLSEAAGTHMCPQLRELFVSLCLFCEVSNPKHLFEQFWSTWSDDFIRKYQQQGLELNDDQLRILTLLDIETRLTSFEKQLIDFGLEKPNPDQISLVDHLINPAPSLIREELDFNVEVLISETNRVIPMLTIEQKNIFDTVLTSVNEHSQLLLFIDARGGSGKTFLLNAILNAVRCSEMNGCIALAMATTGIAATLLHKGRTFHSRMKAPIGPHENSTLNINFESPLADLLRQSKILLIDEATMLDEFLLSAMDRTLRDVMNAKELPFGGKSIVLSGDFRQCLPVIKSATRAGIIKRCISRSMLWHNFAVHHLTVNLRISQGNSRVLNSFDKWCLDIGNGKKENVNIPKKHQWLINSSESLENEMSRFLKYIFPNIISNALNMNYTKSSAILVPKNADVDEFNRIASYLMPGLEVPLLSADSLINSSDVLRFNTEYLNSLTPTGFPAHRIVLKTGMPLTLLRNLSPSSGLCNGTRLIFKKMIGQKLLQCTIMGAERTVFIPRILFLTQASDTYIEWRRRQFPVRPSFAMTINKAQGQTLDKVGLWLNTDAFTHGQLYVGVSRVSHPDNLKIAFSNAERKRPKCENIVFKEILSGST